MINQHEFILRNVLDVGNHADDIIVGRGRLDPDDKVFLDFRVRHIDIVMGRSKHCHGVLNQDVTRRHWP